MQYLSEKVVAINEKLFATAEMIRPAMGGSDNMLILREVEMRVHEYTHPIKGKVKVSKFEKVRQTSKYSITEKQWKGLKDINVENVPVDINA
jgi:hypothetical protein